MTCIVRHRPGLLRYGAAHYITDQMRVPGYCEQQIVEDCIRSSIGIEEFASSQIVLSFLDEGFGPDDIAPLTDILMQSHPDRFMVLFNAHIDVDQLPYRARSFTAWLINRSEYRLDQYCYNSDIELDRKFLCLMRRGSQGRAQLARFLLDNVGLDHVRMSFGSGQRAGLEQYRDIVGCNLPLLVDGVLTDRLKEFDITNTLFQSCLFNIVAETSSQTEKNWHTVFLTEKTWKAIMQRQIPIWHGVAGLVQQMRMLGFDVFDDIVDHTYDTVVDETERFHAVYNIIQKLDQTYSLTQCQQLRQQLLTRLEDNYLKLLEYFRTNRREVFNAILEFDNLTDLTLKSK